jgi:dTDP-4-dehydrorhamnose 3,5-epimerase
MPFEFIPQSIPEVLLIKPKVFGDARGCFLESYREDEYAAAGLPAFVQDNHSVSSKGVLRGLHYQLNFPQGKLVRVAQGKVLDVAVDVRLGSPTFGQWASAILDDENHHQFYVPPGFAHGFSVLSERAMFLYQCTDYYHPEDEQGIAWNDADLNINWQLDGEPNLSQKDQACVPLSQMDRALLPPY